MNAVSHNRTVALREAIANAQSRLGKPRDVIVGPYALVLRCFALDDGAFLWHLQVSRSTPTQPGSLAELRRLVAKIKSMSYREVDARARGFWLNEGPAGPAGINHFCWVNIPVF